jgi:hypothetical protein
MILRWCNDGITMVYEWCKNGATCYNGVTVVSQWCYSCTSDEVLVLRGVGAPAVCMCVCVCVCVCVCATMVLQWCCSGVTIVLQLYLR